MPESPTIDSVEARVFVIPTDLPEGDGTITWDSTTMVTVDVTARGVHGLGWTYASPACRSIIEEQLRGAVSGIDAMATPRAHEAMVRACRNLGRPGIVSCAISAVDVALWDCKARLLEVSLADLLGAHSSAAPVYGSGGFTTYDAAALERQLAHWVDELEIPRVKIKVGESWGTNTGRDVARVAHARRTIGAEVELYVDANGGYSAKQAISVGRRFLDEGNVCWFEEPVSSDNLSGLAAVRDALPLDVTAGEYGYDEPYFERMLAAEAVDCLQIDVTRCGGYTSWLRAAALAHARSLDVSGHCAPNLHAHVGVSVPNLRHLEYFWDHERIESMLFEGALDPTGGALTPDRTRPGHGLALKEADAERYRK